MDARAGDTEGFWEGLAAERAGDSTQNIIGDGFRQFLLLGSPKNRTWMQS